MSRATTSRRLRETATTRRAKRVFLVTVACLLAGLMAWFALPKPALYDGQTFSTLVLARDGQPLKLNPAADGRYRLFTPLDDIAPAMIDATLLYEDRRFYRHPGVDPLALVRAAWTTYLRRTRVVGGSTITMQLARLRFGMDTRTPRGKLHQSFRAVQLERHYDKAEILEAYLNLAPYGGNIEGVGTASRIYFDKPASTLGRGEAFALAVVPQNPSARFPVTAAGRTGLLDARARLLEAWSQRAEPDAETMARAHLVPTFRPSSALPSHAPHFVRDHVPPGHASVIRTTLNLDTQRLVERRIRDHLNLRRADGIANAAAMLIDHRSMEVLALVGSAGFFDVEIAGQVNGVRARRSPGSTLKPLLYASALDTGLIHPMTLLEDAPERYASFTPENFDRGFLGPVFARDALIHSRNVPAVRLLANLGVERFRALLDQARVGGLRPASDYGLALALGGNEMTMEELVQLYATMASGGLWRGVTVQADAGVAMAQPTRLLSPEASFLVLDMLRDVPRPDAPVLADDRRSAIAWKTGTSYGFRDAWSVGVFGRYVLAVWVGNFDGSGNPALVGREAAGPLFFAIADSLDADDDGGQVARSPSGLNLRRVEVCATTGDLPGPHCPSTRPSWFIPGVSPIKVSTIHRAVAVDVDTGLRSCRTAADTVQQVFEFWPSNLRTVIRRAGIAIRSPPPWSPECGLDETSAVGLSPRIRSPQPALVYHATPTGAKQAEVPLSAVADGDAKALYWFVDDRLVATAAPGDDRFWTPRAGRFTVRVVDDLGRADAVAVQVAAAPALTPG
ncbi:MAG: penicillin-binding protein 1C [Gammaproteobacteria bacterium]|nr:penicillin-binding protein 1C [Gammaproteobacteria bacterium]